MTNQFVRIGQLLIDLGRNLPTDVNASDLEDLKMEFVGIKSRLLMIWSRKPPELAYMLEFHSAEAHRLFGSFRQEHLGQDKKRRRSAEELFRIEVYTVICNGLVEVIEHLELLSKGKNIKFRLS
jgi:hypothetical protein